MRCKLIIFLLLGISLTVQSQNRHVIDSLQQKLNRCSEDTNKVITLNDLAWEYIGNNPETCTKYCIQSASLAWKLKYIDGLGLAFHTAGINYYTATRYYDAMAASLKATTCFEFTGNKKRLATVYNNIGNIYWALYKYKPAMQFQRKALRLQEETHNLKGISSSFLNIGLIYADMNRFDSALMFSFRSVEILKKLPGTPVYLKLARVYNNIGMVYRKMNKIDEALKNYLISESYDKYFNNNQTKAVVIGNIAECYLTKNNYFEAQKYYEKKLALANEADSDDDKRIAFDGLAKVFEGLGKYREAYDYQSKSIDLNKKQYNIQSTQKIAELENKYNNDAGERKIEKLTGEKNIQDLKLQQQRIILFSVIGLAFLIIIFSIIIFNFYKQKQIRKRMLTTVIETEEKERKRFAEDLHDGLGPLLSSVSLYMNELKSDRHDPQKKEEFINYSNDLLDDAILNTRTIARNLMPVVLNDFGLSNALKSFCQKLQKSDSVDISILCSEENKRYPTVVEISLYRVILELINNTLKHAGASKIIIKITESDKILNVHYTDDGCGFDVASRMNDKNAGLGLNNITNRIHSVNGKCNIQSEIDKGISVNIEVNYKKF